MPLKNTKKRRHSSENTESNKKARIPADEQVRKTLVTDEEAAENLLKLAMAEPQRKANFSALSASNGMSKSTQPVGSANKPGTAKKLVIKNFKG